MRNSCKILLLLPLFGFAQRPNVLLITIDTLRADHLGCYGDAQANTPNINRLAAEGTRYKTVVTAAPLTLPSHCSIMTGTYPTVHGVRDNVGYRLDPAAETLAQILKRNGYATGAVVGAYVLDRSFGLATGFDSYYDHFDAGGRETVNMAELKRRGSEVTDRGIAWIRRVQGRPFFAWLHFYDPHDPYDPPAPFKHQYDGEIAYVDQQLGRLFAFLNEAGLSRNTIIVLTADHGESLGEHRELRHGYFIYDATDLVPLIIKPLTGKPRVVSSLTRTVDIAPAILQLLGVPKGKAMGVASDSEAYSETFYPLQFGWSPLRSLRVGNLKYIDAPHPELFELDVDPKELTNRAAERPAVAAEMKNKLQILEASSGAAARAVYHLTAEQVEKLAKLGYLGNADAPHGEMAKLPDPKDEIDTFYLINRAGVEAGSGHCDRAVPVLLDVLEKSPNVVAAHTMLGRCYFLLEKYDESLRAFRRLQALSPENSDASFYIAASEFKLDELTSAEAGFEHIVMLDPKRGYAHKYLGFIYQAQGKPELAIAEFEKVIETMPNDIEAHGKLGFLLSNASRRAEALPHFQKVVTLDPSDGSAHYNLGLAYEKSGDQAKAARELAAACKLERHFCGK